MIGGRGAQSSKLYQLTSSAITELPILPFQFEGPLCQSYNDKDVYACASVSDERRCWQIRGTGGYHYISHLMLDSHAFGSLIQYNEELLVMGKGDIVFNLVIKFNLKAAMITYVARLNASFLRGKHGKVFQQTIILKIYTALRLFN